MWARPVRGPPALVPPRSFRGPPALMAAPWHPGTSGPGGLPVCLPQRYKVDCMIGMVNFVTQGGWGGLQDNYFADTGGGLPITTWSSALPPGVPTSPKGRSSAFHTGVQTSSLSGALKELCIPPGSTDLGHAGECEKIVLLSLW